jgi:hypothetical protein
MLIVEGHRLPIGVPGKAANSHKVTQVQDTLVSVFTEELPERLIGDTAYAGDGYDFPCSAPEKVPTS